MTRIVLLSLFLAVWGAGCTQKQPANLPQLPDENLNFIVANDMGRRGKSKQKDIAGLMALSAEQNRITFLAVAGDPIHDDGVQSIDDNEWKVKIEDVYTAPALHAIPWYVISGNHEYNGNVQAILDYSAISKRWNAPARYYTFTEKLNDSDNECVFVFIDTSPFIDKYRNDKQYSDAGEQDVDVQLRWLDSVLVASNDARWKIVIGHHPIYADTKKVDSERTDMQARVGVILENREVDFYIGGHIHNFQHIQPEGRKVNYIVNSSASRAREVKPIEGTIFCNPDPGYALFTVSADSVRFFFVNHTGNPVYDKTVKK